jgi:hypothetical protein
MRRNRGSDKRRMAANAINQWDHIDFGRGIRVPHRRKPDRYRGPKFPDNKPVKKQRWSMPPVTVDPNWIAYVPPLKKLGTHWRTSNVEVYPC